MAPDVPDLHATLGIFFQEQGETKQAIASHSRAIELEPGYGPAYYYRALAFIVVDDLEGAIADLESFLSVSSETQWRAQAEMLLQSLRSEEGLP
jgi:lipoprotein NlpI